MALPYLGPASSHICAEPDVSLSTTLQVHCSKSHPQLYSSNFNDDPVGVYGDLVKVSFLDFNVALGVAKLSAVSNLPPFLAGS